MHEYIKKLSVSLCLLEGHIKDIEYKTEVKKLGMSLINFNIVFSDWNMGSIEIELLSLRKVLIQVVDLLDILKIAGKISTMNADIILNAAVKIIEELDKKILHTKSFILPKFSLSEMSQNILRDKVKEDLQNQYLKNHTVGKATGKEEVFNFTKISVPVEPGLNDLTDYTDKEQEEKKQDNTHGLEKTEDVKVEDIKVEELKVESIEPMVFTVFGDAEQVLINERRAQIMAILKNGGGSIASVSKQIPGLNPKTLQRDLIELMRERKVIMLGKKRWAKYYLK